MQCCTLNIFDLSFWILLLPLRLRIEYKYQWDTAPLLHKINECLVTLPRNIALNVACNVAACLGFHML